MNRANVQGAFQCGQNIGKYTSKARFHAEAITQGYVVVDPAGKVVAGSQTPFRIEAQRAATESQRAADKKAKRGPRPCLCCGESFASEGIHNRLCDKCRRRDAALSDDVRPSLPRANGRSS